MTTYAGYSHTVSFAKDEIFLAEFQDLIADDTNIAECLKKNFIDPIENKLCPFEEIIGRYKPSCEESFSESPMKQGFISLAQKNNLYHYHFGYKFYKEGNPDSKYHGRVSDGILHTKLIINEEKKTIEHRIIQICTSHPTPFTIPFGRMSF